MGNSGTLELAATVAICRWCLWMAEVDLQARMSRWTYSYFVWGDSTVPERLHTVVEDAIQRVEAEVGDDLPGRADRRSQTVH
jgi:hypothetical protein